MQAVTAKFAQSFLEYPPSQKPGEFNIKGIVEKLKEQMGSH
jgi:hypothetical protein